MDIIERIANNIYLPYINRGPKPHSEVLLKVKEKIYDIDNKVDKIKFLKFLLDKTNEEFEKHLPHCKDPKECKRNFEYESIIYYLQQELQRLGVIINEDTFTKEEIIIADGKIGEVLNEIKKLKLGQEVIYEDLVQEIEELKSYYFLGKKTWYQIFIGKLTEMSLGGIVSETISKGLIQIVKSGIKLIGI